MPLAELSLQVNGQKVPFRFPDSKYMRPHLKNILEGVDYPKLPHLPPGYEIHTIIDIGANVGAAALWFLAAAPEARVVCFEPSRENFECLSYNLQSFRRVECYHCGLFSTDRAATLHLGAQQCMQHSVVAGRETGEGVETIDLRRASTEFDRIGIDRISILKIDTEGCEIPILEDLGPERIARVDMLYLEWHSDADRRRIDTIVGKDFLLAHARARVHRGNNVYLSTALAAQFPQMEAPIERLESA